MCSSKTLPRTTSPLRQISNLQRGNRKEGGKMVLRPGLRWLLFLLQKRVTQTHQRLKASTTVHCGLENPSILASDPL